MTNKNKKCCEELERQVAELIVERNYRAAREEAALEAQRTKLPDDPKSLYSGQQFSIHGNSRVLLQLPSYRNILLRKVEQWALISDCGLTQMGVVKSRKAVLNYMKATGYRLK